MTPNGQWRPRPAPFSPSMACATLGNKY